MQSVEKKRKYLLIDVGAGTMDVLYYESWSGIHYKAVVRSPVNAISEFAAALPGDLLIRGCEMGGGALSGVLQVRAQSANVIMTPSAAMTISHNPDKVRSLGIQILDDETVHGLSATRAYSELFLTDLPMPLIQQIVSGFGVSLDFDVIGICAQDHGMPPENTSHLDYRHSLFKKILDENPYPEALLYQGSDVPETFNRLKSMAESAGHLPAEQIYIMDSGFAAILGASMDMAAMGKENILVLDVATSHTVGAALKGKEIAGFFEYHTRDITCDKIEGLLQDLADNKLTHEQILRQGGHGAYTRHGFGFKNVEAIIATGPKRRLLESSNMPITFGSPLGDNMMTGTVGLLEAIRRRMNLAPINYL